MGEKIVKAEIIGVNSSSSQVDDPITKDIDKIVSTLCHLYPRQTSANEILVLKNAKSEIHFHETRFRPGKEYFINFVINDIDISLSLDEKKYIELSIRQKFEIVFNWYPGCYISDVQIVSQNSLREPPSLIRDGHGG